MDEDVLSAVDWKVGRTGIETLKILVTGVARQGPGCGFDRLHGPANRHVTPCRFLGDTDVRDVYQCQYRRLGRAT